MGFKGSERNGYGVLVVKRVGREVRWHSAIDKVLRIAEAIGGNLGGREGERKR